METKPWKNFKTLQKQTTPKIHVKQKNHMPTCTNVILSGGSGTRLWPLSRQKRPKQFLKIFQQKSLFQNTLLRNIEKVRDFMLITHASQIESAREQAKEIEIDIAHQIIEPVGRNTAPAIALACMALPEDRILFVTPSDQMIEDGTTYRAALERAITLAEEGHLVTFGIRPKHPETGFGYIEAAGESVVRFREKPDLKTAKEFVASGNFFWNSGMFCFRAKTYLEELEKHHPEMLAACKRAHQTKANGQVTHEAMSAIPDDSIDYAVLEKSRLVKTVSAAFEWTDLGSFDALIEYAQKQAPIDGLNKIPGSENAYAFSEKCVRTAGMDHFFLVDTPDAVLILPLGESQAVKTIHQNLRENNPTLL